MKRIVLCMLTSNTRVLEHLNQLTLWSKVLLSKLIVSQLGKKLPSFYGKIKFITTRHSNLS
jgi:hypothetical protein